MTIQQGYYNLAIAAIAEIAAVSCTFSAFYVSQGPASYNLAIAAICCTFSAFLVCKSLVIWSMASVIDRCYNLAIALLAHFISINDQSQLPYNEALTILQLLQLRPLVALLAHFTSLNDKALTILQLRQFVALLAHFWSVRALLYGQWLQSLIEVRCAKSATNCCNWRNLLHF